MTDEPEVLDGEVVTDTPPEPTPAPEQSTSMALAPRQRRSEVIRPLDPDQLVESFQAYQQLLPKLLDASDYQDAGRGKKFKKKSAWRKIATAFDIDVVAVSDEVERDDAGQPIRAKAIYRAISPSGRSMDGDGYCSVDEERFSGPRGNKSKVEHDLRSTAVTRAKNRAISDLVGMGEVSAEEVNSGSDDAVAPAVASEELRTLVGNVIRYLVEFDEPSAAKALDALAKQFPEGLPAAAGQAIVHVGTAVKGMRDARAEASP